MITQKIDIHTISDFKYPKASLKTIDKSDDKNLPKIEHYEET